VNLTKNIQLKSNNLNDQDPEEFARVFPSFTWVVRDFSLQLLNEQS
jgi:hypothetical protein